MPKMTKREKFDNRMNTLPANSIVNITILTDAKGKITGWVIGNYTKIEGRYEHLEKNT